MRGVGGSTVASRRVSALIALALAATLAGCLADPAPPSAQPTPSASPDATPTVTSWYLDTTVWYAGLEIRFGTATASLDAKGGPVTVTLALENRGDADAGVAGPIRLTAGGRGIEPTRDSVLPTVPAGGRIAASIAFDVDAAFDLATATLRVGRAEEHQAIVPIVRGAAETETLEPVTLGLSSTATAGTLRVRLTSVELRADLPDWNQELARDVLALTVRYDATFRSDFTGGFPFTGDSVSLRLPDGRTVGGRKDGRSQSVAVIGPGATLPQLLTRFEVPAPGGGAYAFLITDGSARASIPFTIELP